MIFKEPALIEASEKRYQEYHDQIQKHQEIIQSEESLDTNFERLNPDSSLLSERIHRLGETQEAGFERLIGSRNNLLHVNYLKKGIRVANTVCRLVGVDVFQNYSPIGTGFLVSPNLLMTNNHVIPDIEAARSIKAQFGYELGFDGSIQPFSVFELKPDTFFVTSDKDNLDYTLVAVAPKSDIGVELNRYGWNRLIGSTGKAVNGEPLTIIQHPNGQPKQIALRENMLVHRDDRFLIYQTDTNPGSSGSPVFNNQWEIVALHHSGVPKTNQANQKLTRDGTVWNPMMGEQKIHWIANEGVRISAIMQDLRSRNLLGTGEQELRSELLETPGSYPDIRPHLPDYLAGPNRSSLISDSGEGNVTAIEPSKDTHGQKSKLAAHLVRYELQMSNNLLALQSALMQIQEKWGRAAKQVFKNNDAQNAILNGFYEISLPVSTNVWEVARELEAVDGVVEVDPDLPTLTRIEPVVEKEPAAYESISGNSGSNREQIEARYEDIHTRWNHEETNFPKAIEYLEKRKSLPPAHLVKVAQLDTGYSGHPEIEGLNVEEGYDFVDNDGIAQDQFVEGFYPQGGHGTRTAAVFVGKKTDNPKDANDGVFPYVDFVPFRVSNSVVILGTANNVTQAVHHAIKNGFDIVTMSMGSYGRTVWRELAKLAYENGVFWVCAAGNQVGFVVWPAAYPGTIAVGGTNYDSQPWSGSSRGKAVNVCAPGENVFVPRAAFKADKMYNYGSGTSYATPHIAAAIALWLSYHEDRLEDLYEFPWQRIEAFRYCMNHSVKIPDDWDETRYGAGILDALKLLKIKLPTPEQLTHKYRDHQWESYKSRTKVSLAEKELLYHYWNRTGLNAESQQKQYCAPYLQPLSPAAENLYVQIKSQASHVNEAIGDNVLDNYFTDFLNNRTF